MGSGILKMKNSHVLWGFVRYSQLFLPKNQSVLLLLKLKCSRSVDRPIETLTIALGNNFITDN